MLAAVVQSWDASCVHCVKVGIRVKALEVELIYQLRLLLELIMHGTKPGICRTTHCMVFIYEYLHLLYCNLLSK